MAVSSLAVSSILSACYEFGGGGPWVFERAEVHQIVCIVLHALDARVDADTFALMLSLNEAIGVVGLVAGGVADVVGESLFARFLHAHLALAMFTRLSRDEWGGASIVKLPCLPSWYCSLIALKIITAGHFFFSSL